MKNYKELDDELRALRDEFKNNPSEELKEQILLTDKKLRDIENSQARYYRPIGNYIQGKTILNNENSNL